MEKPKQRTFLAAGEVFYRAVWTGNQGGPLETKSDEGRYHTVDDMCDTIYLSASPETAMEEVKRRWGGKVSEYEVVRVRVRLARCVDLTDEATQGHLGVTEKELAGDRWRPCQRIAAALRVKGHEGAWTYSAADYPDGRSLIIFKENLEPGSGVELE